MGRVTDRTPTVRIDLAPDGGHGHRVVRRADTLAVEEPLELRVGGRPVSVTMRTPGDDFDLAIGYLVGEGMIAGAGDVATLMHCRDAGEDGRPTFNVVDISLSDGVPPPDPRLDRLTTTTSACGICGTTSIDLVRKRSRYDVSRDEVRLDAAVLARLPELMRERQTGFARTGGLHAAALFSTGGELLCLREDVGRHNAVDKVVGWAARQGRLPMSAHVLAVSGRASFELTQKALMAGAPVLAAVSAPSSLAVSLAEEVGLTVVGFLRGSTMNVYSHAERVRTG